MQYKRMSRSLSMKSVTICLFFILQLVAPLTIADGGNPPQVVVGDSEQIDSLDRIGITPSQELINGWFDSEHSAGEITLLYRTLSTIPIEQFSQWTGETILDGRYIITHQLPVPTEWRYELAEYGIDCDSFMPPNGFNCRLNNVNINQLSELSVLGVAKLDAVDKIRYGLAESLLLNNQLIIDVVLSGYNLPDGIHNRDDISILSYSSRFATVETGITGVNWLSNQDEVEWLEEKPVAYIQNSVANTIINSDDIRDHTKMSALDTSWSGLDGSGITVTVGDTGLDSGVNDATMHPDFSDHILGIYSWPRPYSECAWNSPSDPGSCDDGADDDHGHGTHVAGSVLGDGTASGGSVVGLSLIHI